MIKSEPQICVACDGTGKDKTKSKGFYQPKCPACNGRKHHFTLSGSMRPVRTIRDRSDPATDG